MAKQPLPGEVKTRLIPAIGAESAALLAQAFLEDTLQCITSLKWARPILACTGPVTQHSVCERWIQAEGDLGTRQENVLRRAIESSHSAILIGADCPGLPISFLEEARNALAHYDAVLGPSHDGGYYLIGLRYCPRGLLAGIPWSQPDTFIQALSKLQDTGMRVAVIDPWFDIDTPEDLATLAKRIFSNEIRAPHTALALRRAFRSNLAEVQDRARPANGGA